MTRINSRSHMKAIRRHRNKQLFNPIIITFKGVPWTISPNRKTTRALRKMGQKFSTVKEILED